MPHVTARQPAQPAASIGQWSALVREHVMRLDITSPKRGFSARLARRQLGAMPAIFIQAAEQYVARPRHAVPDEASRFFLMQTRHVPHRVEHCGRAVTLQPGECMLLDAAMPFAFGFPQGADNVLLAIPTAALARALPLPEAVAGRVLPAAAWSAPLAALMSAITPHSLDDLALSEAMLGEQVLHLLALATAEAPGGEGGAHHARLLRRARVLLAERCGEPDLAPADLAGDLGIATRSLHALFAREGSSFGRELIAVRLDQAAALLGDRRFAGIAVSEVGFRCGFRDASHFARRFRARHGRTPREFARGR